MLKMCSTKLGGMSCMTSFMDSGVISISSAANPTGCIASNLNIIGGCGCGAGAGAVATVAAAAAAIAKATPAGLPLRM
jgi:hypothetical protein